ncbi:hypothetical protein SLE2022_348400 [Rubroshorea leprosula]
MDCNKDEAIRAKELAEKKLSEMDIRGAKKFAVRAQNLCPRLDGLAQLLATLDVYVSSENRINGEVDWYGVLGVQPFADDDTIRKNYRKLALVLHPDKNKSVGADGAFKTLSEAWSVLSDKTKRMSYDQKQNFKGIYADVFNGNPSSSMPTNWTNNNTFNTRNHQCATHPYPAAPSSQVKNDTFWTTCSSCKVQFEYLRNYLNHSLHCIHCHKSFMAVETPPLSMNSSNGSTPRTSNNLRQNTSQMHNMRPTRFSGIQSLVRVPQSGAFSKLGGNIGVSAPSFFTAQATDDSKPAFEQLKRGNEEAHTTGLRDNELGIKFHDSQRRAAVLDIASSGAGSGSTIKAQKPKKRRCINDHEWRWYEGLVKNQVVLGNGVGVPKAQNSSSEPIRANFPRNFRFSSTRELSLLEIRNMLMMKAKTEIRRKLNDWDTASKPNALHESNIVEKEISEKQQGSGADAENGGNEDTNKSADVMDVKTRIHPKKLSSAVSDADSTTEDVDPIMEEADLMSMSVPDPDFHDFDNDRTEKSFGDNQVWAAYDNDDGMPRYYAMIHSVMSLKPFKMRISWLNSKSNHELSPLNWIGSGFYKTSGDFWIGKYVINKLLNSFSHKVKWSKGRKGAIQIYPRKGDVWALYRNWSPDWNELTPDEVIHKYDMVEVLEDYNEQSGAVVVGPLVKVAGFKTVFRQHPEPSMTRIIPREQLFQLSHQVPSYLLTGQEGPNVPKGCLELDPAAMPLELLKVLTEAQVKEMEVTTNLEISEEREQVEIGKPLKLKPDIIPESIGKSVGTEVEERKEIKMPQMIVYRRRRTREWKISRNALNYDVSK